MSRNQSRGPVHGFLFTMAVLAFLGTAAAGQTVTGTLFEDLDRDGVLDPGEPRLTGQDVSLFGNQGATDLTVTTDSQGTYLFTPPGSALYALEVPGLVGLRGTLPGLTADPHPIPDFPVGRRRPGVLEFLASNLRAATVSDPLRHAALGDSIAVGFNMCDSWGGENDYISPLTDRLGLTGEDAVLLEFAELGYETADLLNPTLFGSIFDAITAEADLVTISIGGNDFLEFDGNEAATAANLVQARRNVQEILSTLVTALPGTDVVLNTIYDNEEGGNAFHNRWGTIFNQALRDVAWGQAARVQVAEIWPDYAHEDPATGAQLGQRDLICDFFLDKIHPVEEGYDLHLEKVWQGAGGVEPGASGEIRSDLGFLRRIDARTPSQFLDVGGGARDESDAFVEDDKGAFIPGGNQELQIHGFDAFPRGLLEQVVVNVRYRTSATPVDDYYRFEASVDGTFSAPGSDAFTWNTIVPIVGGAGNAGAPVLAFPDQPQFRTVSALVTQGAPTDGSSSLTWQDLDTLRVRIQGQAVGGTDPFEIEWDAAWLDVYGVPELRLLLRGDGTPGTELRFDATGPAGALSLLFLSAGTGNLDFPPWGTFEIDLSKRLLILPSTVRNTGAATIKGLVPSDPDLSGFTLHAQALVVEDLDLQIGGLTNLVSITFP